MDASLRRTLLLIALVAAVYYVAGRIGRELAYLDGAVAAALPPAGVGLAVLLLFSMGWPTAAGCVSRKAHAAVAPAPSEASLHPSLTSV